MAPALSIGTAGDLSIGAAEIVKTDEATANCIVFCRALSARLMDSGHPYCQGNTSQG